MQAETRKLVSVIVPAYKCERYIKVCLDSVLEQTYRPLEVIVVYDFSPDNTLSILEKYSKDIRLVVQNKKTNPATARNIGLDLAKGQYIAFCDADDYFEPTKIEKQIEVIEQSETDFTYTDVILVDSEGDLIGRKVKPQISRNNFNAWIADPFITFSSILMKKDLLGTVSGFDESLDVVEDTDLLLRMIASAKGVKTNGFLTYYRLHSGNISRNLILRKDFCSIKMLHKYGLGKQIMLYVYRYLCPHMMTGLLRKPSVVRQELLRLIIKNPNHALNSKRFSS